MARDLKERLTCSAFSTASGEQLFGTAPIWERCICVEVPLPWNQNLFLSNFFQDHLLTDYLTQCTQKIPGLRILGIVNNNEEPTRGIRVLAFDKSGGNPGKSSYLFPKDSFKETLSTLIREPDCSLLKPYAENSEGIRDYVVCTHGNRDVCCGFWGYQLYKELCDNYATEKVRFWRASHIGGHKFAPTLLSLDDARYWGRVEARDFARIINREFDVEDINAMYRGKATCRSAQEQLIEKELLNRFGWDLDVQQVSIRLLGSHGCKSEYTVAISAARDPDAIVIEYVFVIEENVTGLTYGCTARPTFNSGKRYSIVGASRFD